MFTIPQSVLIVIDVQGKLAEIVYEANAVVQNTQRLLKAVRLLEIPILVTEQRPDKIGPTIKSLTPLLTGMTPIPKKSFSCCGEKQFKKELDTLKRHQLIVCGIEAHVCVVQTVEHLLQQSFQVQVVADAVSSRTLENKRLALRKMEKRGATLTSTEMILTELLQSAEHPKFKEVLSLIK